MQHCPSACPRCYTFDGYICECPVCRFEDEVGSSLSTTSQASTWTISQDSTINTSFTDSSEESQELLTYKGSSTLKTQDPDNPSRKNCQEHFSTNEEEQLNKPSLIAKKMEFSSKKEQNPSTKKRPFNSDATKQTRQTEPSYQKQNPAISNGSNPTTQPSGLQECLLYGQCTNLPQQSLTEIYNTNGGMDLPGAVNHQLFGSFTQSITRNNSTNGGTDTTTNSSLSLKNGPQKMKFPDRNSKYGLTGTLFQPKSKAGRCNELAH